ncbi:GGDEF domain-containing protein [Terriglobus tenax]|uniref:GGDEF domain-containing protein n=1 Tax=Terriglobus tenax TaxID=1111115 RepID=UPI0021DF9929|nr:GGDEF domain-containing protein [Terriglobus tenax]
MLSSMRSSRRDLRCIAALLLLGLAALVIRAEQVHPETQPASSIVIEGLGRGTFALNGPWQFHVGDDLAWANPAFDSSTWEQLSADRPWGKQGHANLTGFAWYRCNLVLSPAPGITPRFSIMIPRIKDAYEVYWNGTLIGQNGKVPPHPVQYFSQPAQTFELGAVKQGVLAVRVWKAPLLSDDSSGAGGFWETPLIGGSADIATARDAREFQWLRHQQFLFGVNLLCGTVAILSFLLWLRVPSRWVLFWTGGFALAAPAELLLLQAHLGLPYVLAMGASQPLVAVQDVSLWFLLLWLLSLHENQRLSRLTRILAIVYMANAVLDGFLVALSWQPQRVGLVQLADAISTIFWIILEAYPLLLLMYALRKRRQFDSASLLLAVCALFYQLLILAGNIVKQGRQFTDWAIADTIDLPLFSVGGTGVSLPAVASALLFIAIVYAVYNSIREDQRRSDALEREKIALLHESDRMRHEAEHDGLTGLWNHRFIVERLRQEMDRSLREGMQLSVALIDVDHFKKINDSYGHMAGDVVLREISAIFMRSLRSYDSVGRYGGEEFLLILPNCGIEAALGRAEQLRMAVESECFMDGETQLQVTASFGVASPARDDCDAEAVIRAVDEALYKAKSNGRNCVVRADMPGEA